MTRWILPLAIAALLAGCAGHAPLAPNGVALSSSDYGTAPEDADALITTYLRDRLKDPYSAQVERVAGPSRMFVKSSLLSPAAYGWGMCFKVNAKNTFGAYGGFQLHAFIWRDGRVQRTFGGLGDALDATGAEDVCKAIGAIP